MRVVTPRLRQMLYVILTLFGVIAANGLYLATITGLQHFTGQTYENHFYQLMFLGHLGLGFILIMPVVVFGFVHMWRARNRRNRRAVKIGYALLVISIVVLVSGVLLTRVGRLNIVDPSTRSIVYWAHILAPLAAVWLYWLHRLVGPQIKWHVGRKVGLAIACFVGLMVAIQASDPRVSEDRAPSDGDNYFRPSLAKTSTRKFIAAETLMNDDYCLRCHEDVYDSALHGAHRLSSFNNPAYRVSVRESRAALTERDGSLQGTRFCAGCHDPVPFFSGEFDNRDYDDVNNPTAHAGITCTVCHAIQSVDSKRGNGDYTIDEPKHYPFAYSDNPFLQELNSLMVKAKPAFHKQEMLKPLHKTAEFCGACHKVHIPGELTDYKEFLRGQNHYDSYLLSGVSGHGARSFYYPDKAQKDCNGCHMPEIASSEFGAKFSDTLGSLAVHNHQFASANSALSYWYGDEQGIENHRKLLSGSLRIDLFGIRDGASIDSPLIAPLDELKPKLRHGQTYLLETVLRTLTLGHHFTQGTTDSNEIWIEITVRDGDKVIGNSGHRDDHESVDPWSHFVNTFMLNRQGGRIERRDVQNIFTPLYSHQIPPGAGQTVHYQLDVPEQTSGTIEVTARLLYRKFDSTFLDIVRADRDPDIDKLDLGNPGDPNDLPIIEIASDKVAFAIEGSGTETTTTEKKAPVWQRWNDYGIGLLLKGKAELRQAGDAFRTVETLGRYDGPLNLARVQFAEGDLDGATASLVRADAMETPPPTWTASWLSGMVNRQQGNLDTAAESLRATLGTKIPDRGFDFSVDYVVRNQLGLTLIDIAQRHDLKGDDAMYQNTLRQAETEFQSVLSIDVENVTAHASLAEIYSALGDEAAETKHRELHTKYKPDDNAAELARPAARRQYPAANRAAEALVIYQLNRDESGIADSNADESNTPRPNATQ